MKRQQRKPVAVSLISMIGALLSLFPTPSMASIEIPGIAAAIPIEMNGTTFLIIGALLVGSIIMLFAVLTRFNRTNKMLADITAELSDTRQHLTETSQQLEETETNLENTTTRHEGILLEAQVGMFQIELNGTCSYINTAMQEISGLYPKKALKEGFQSALHPDDLNAFQEAWDAFTDQGESFNLRCRFQHAKGRIVHTECRASKVLDKRKDTECYIGWVSNVTPFHEEELQLKTHTARYKGFIDETIEYYFQLVPKKPIAITDSSTQMAKTILEEMILESCNETFATLYGMTPEKLEGKTIDALQGGCGPFTDLDSIQKFTDNAYKLINIESAQQDFQGTRLILLNNIVGLIEDNMLVGIRGSQRNISRQTREKAALRSETKFMHRILDALPADVQVKDTRCRYLYASQKLADRTGIPKKEWIGKTIFDALPATPPEHDKSAIAVMKNKKITYSEYPYKTQGKSGWMETIQIPLVSNDDLVEGVIELSLEISGRKKREEEIRRQRQQLSQQLGTRTEELALSQDEHGKTAIALRDTTQKLQIRDAELENFGHEFEQQIAKHKHTEELLQRNEETLLTHQKQLEQQLSTQLEQLNQETDKRKKQEGLIAIKEETLSKLEKNTLARKKKLEAEISHRKQTEADLATSQAALEKHRKELELITQERDLETATLTDKHQKKFRAEHASRKQTEGQLKRTDELLQKTQSRLKGLTEQHATELEHEVSERKIATTKLIQTSEELDELKTKFTLRIEAETKTLKRELAQKQIREKALRQNEKDQGEQIKNLEKILRLKTQEQTEQIHAREGADAQCHKIEDELEKLNTRQEALIERETQKLNLNIADIRLHEIKLRKAVDDLQQDKDELETLIETRSTELGDAEKAQQKLAKTLSNTQEKLDQTIQGQSDLVARETETIQNELRKLKTAEHDLHKQNEQLQTESDSLETTTQKLAAKLKDRTTQREEAEKQLHELQVAFDANQNNIKSQIAENAEKLTQEIEQHKQNEAELQESGATLNQQASVLRKTLDTRTVELAQARQERKNAEAELTQNLALSSQDAKKVAARLAKIQQNHQDEIDRIETEQNEIRQKEKYYRALIQSSGDAFLQIDPKSGKVQSANLAAANLFNEENVTTLIGKTLDNLSPNQQSDKTPSTKKAKEQIRIALESGYTSFDWQFKKSDGTLFDGLTSLSTIEIEEKKLIIAMIHDISEIKRQQAELKQAIDEAQAINRSNSKLVDDVTDAVQTSLSPVVETSASIEKSDNLSSAQKLDMEKVNRNCRSLIDMMHYRRELSHVVDGSDKIISDPCDLHQIIKNLDEQFCHRAETKKLFFAISFAQYQSANNVPQLVETDETKVRKILEILLGYAISHTEKGRIGLHAANKSSDEETILISFELAYTGTSKTDGLLARVFNTNNPNDLEGMKYGLTLARRYIYMLGGEVSFEYRHGDITALIIDLPFKKVEQEIVTPEKDEPKKTD